MIWLAADNITLAANAVNALGAPGSIGGQSGSGGSGGAGGCGGSGDDGCNGQNGSSGAGGATGPAGPTGGKGGAGDVRLDYATLTGSTNPAPGYTSGVYYALGTIASNVWDTGAASENWTYLSWQETVPSGTGITFEARARNNPFLKDDNTIPWTSVGGASPVTSGLPSGRYMQWQATLTTSNNFYTPVLHSVTAASSQLPLVATNAATNVAYNGAVLNGTLNSLGQSSKTVLVSFGYGTTPTLDSSWLYTSSIELTAPGTYAIGTPPLLTNKQYFFMARAYDVDPAQAVFGGVMNFTTSYISPSVTTNPAGSVTASSAVLNGYLGSLGTSSMVNISYQWGTTQGGPYPNSTQGTTLDAPGPFQAPLSNLGTGTTYYYRAKAGSGANWTNYGAEVSFTTLRVSPLVATGNASTVTSNSAMLNGSLANMGAASTVNVSYQWGTTQGGPYPNSTPAQAMTAAGPFSAGLTGLTAKTTYYFRAKADGSTSGTSFGTENSFTTSVVQPTVITNGATGITSSSAVLNGTLANLGTAATVNVAFYYGLQPGGSNRTAWQILGAPGSFQAGLTGLAADTLYYFRTVAQGDGNRVDGAELTFRTSRVPPTVATDNATDVPPNSAILYGTLTDVGSASSDNVSFQWGQTSGMYSNETPPQIMSAAGDFHADLTPLASNTTYYYRAKANGGIDGIGYGEENSFTTGKQPPSVTTGSVSQLTTSSAMLNGNLDSKGSVDSAASVNVSFQWGITKGGPYPNATVPHAQSATGAFQAGLSGLTSRTTYYYRAKADGGTCGTAYGVEKSFSTSSFPPYVVTGEAENIDTGSATLNGNLYFLGSANTVNVYFVYGTTHKGPYTVTTPLQPLITTLPFIAPLSGLNPATTYYYRAMGNGGQYGTSRGEEQRFTTSTKPPSVSTNAASLWTANAATLNGNLSKLGTANPVNVSFQYGTTSGGPYPINTAATPMDAPGDFTTGLTGLDANTAYYYRAKADGGINGISYGGEMSFTTLTVPPSVTTDNATSVAASSAILNGSLTSLGSASTVKVYFSYSTDKNSYSENTTQQAMAGQGLFQANIIGLHPLTTYYYSAAADGGLNGSAQGVQCSFTTGAVPPSVSTDNATSITSSSATLYGTLQAMGTSSTDNVSFQWGRQPGVYDNQTTPQSVIDTGDFSAVLSELSDNTTYYYRAVASGGRCGTSFGDEQAFNTRAQPPSVTTSAATEPTTNTAFLNGNLTALGTAKPVNVSFIYGTTHKGPYPYATAPRGMSAPGVFPPTGVTGLSPNTTYYFKARADGGIYGTSYGTELNFTTNRLPPIVGTGGAIDVMTNAAILDGTLYLPGSASSVNVYFSYGTAPNSYSENTTLQAMTGPDDFQAQLTGLKALTTYYYKAYGDGDSSGTGSGVERAFTTGKHPPIASTADAGGITAGSAALNGNLISVGSSPSDNVSFQYGTSQRGPYPDVTTPQAQAVHGAFQTAISSLSAHTAYYYRAVAEGGIYGAGYGREISFITSNVPPSVATGYATAITANAARLNGSLASLGSSAHANVSFQWGAAHGAYTNETAAQPLTSEVSFSADLAGLTQGSTYYFRAKAVGDGTGYGVEQNFTTLTPAPPPTPPLTTPAPPPHSSGQVQSVPPMMPVQLPNIVVQGASLSTSNAAPGAPIEVTATVVNRGSARGQTAVKLYINGLEEDSRSFTLDGGRSGSVTFRVSRDELASYDVYVGGVHAGSFTVTRDFAPDLLLIVSSALVVAALVLACIYVWRRRQQGY